MANTPPYGMSASTALWRASAGNFKDAGTTPAVIDTDVVAQVASQDGNVQALTQTTAGDRPKLVTSAANGKAAWQFAGISTVTMGLDLPAGLTSDKQNLMVLVACRGLVGKSGSNQGAGLVWVGSGGPLLKCTQTGIGLDISGVDFKPTQGSAMADVPQIIAYRANATNLKFYIDGVYTTIAALSSGTSTGGCIGNAADSFALAGEIYEVLMAPASDADLLLAVAGMSAAYGVTVPTSQVWIGVESNVQHVNTGNSLYAYGKTALSQAWATGLLPKTMKVVNDGLSGQTVATMVTNVAQCTSIINTTTFGLTGNIFAFTGGGNDLNGGATLAATKASIQSLGQAIRNAGGIPVWIDPPAAGAGSVWNSTVRGNLDSLRTWGATNWPSFAAARVPLPTKLADATDTTVYDTDQLHLNDAGELVLGAAIAPFLNSTLAGYGATGARSACGIGL